MKIRTKSTAAYAFQHYGIGVGVLATSRKDLLQSSYGTSLWLISSAVYTAGWGYWTVFGVSYSRNNLAIRQKRLSAGILEKSRSKTFGQIIRGKEWDAGEKDRRRLFGGDHARVGSTCS